jgi:hypothetical protein
VGWSSIPVTDHLEKPSRNLRDRHLGQFWKADAGYFSQALKPRRSAPRANRCYLPADASLLIPSTVLNFLPEFVRHCNGGCEAPARLGHRSSPISTSPQKIHIRGDHGHGRRCRMVRLARQRRSWSGRIGTAKQQRSGDLRANWFSGKLQARPHRHHLGGALRNWQQRLVGRGTSRLRLSRREWRYARGAEAFSWVARGGPCHAPDC